MRDWSPPHSSASSWRTSASLNSEGTRISGKLKKAFQLRHKLGVEEVAVDHDAILDLAAETGLTAYDTSYLWAARQFQAELVTLDRQLAIANAAPRS